MSGQRHAQNSQADVTQRSSEGSLAVRGPGRKCGTPIRGWQQRLVSRIGGLDRTHRGGLDRVDLVEQRGEDPPGLRTIPSAAIST